MQTTKELKTLQVWGYIPKQFYQEEGAEFMLILVLLVKWSNSFVKVS